VTAQTIGTGRAVEVLHDRGPDTPEGQDQWTGGSGYLIGGRLVLTAAHNVDYRQDLGDDEQLLVRTISGSEFAARVMLVGDEPSQVDLALLEIRDPKFDDYLPPVTFAQVNRDSPAPVSGCWAVGFPSFAEAGPVLPGGSRRETWPVRGDILPGAKLRAGLLSLLVTSTPQSSPSLTGSEWEGMSGAVVFATVPDVGELVVGVITMHHRAEGESALTLGPITAIAGLPTAAQWWQQLGVADPETLLVLPPHSAAEQLRSRLTGERALKEHWDPRGRGVERSVRPGWFFTGRRQALSQLVTWLTAASDPDDNLRVITGGPGSGKSAVLARLVTMSDPRYRAGLPGPLAADDPVADLPPGTIDVAVHARTAPTGEVVRAIAAAAGAPQADLDGLIETLLERGEAFTIAVDALDEADDPPALARALRRLAGETADAGVRLLIGTRPGGPERRLITALGPFTRDDDPALIDLDTPGYLSVGDLAEYVRRRLLFTGVPPAPGRPDTPYRGLETLAGQVAGAVASAAYPTFLIGQLVSRSLVLRDQPLRPEDPGWQRFPKTVAGAMDQYLASVGNRAEQDRVEDLLRPLAYARGDGLPLDDTGLWPRLATVLARPGRIFSTEDVDRLLDTAADYLVETVVTGQAAYYRLYHQALSDRLRERDQQHPRPVSAAQTIYQCLLGAVAARPDGSRSWLAAHRYLLSQLAGYAADAGQLASLIDDQEFLVAADPPELFAALQRPGQPPAGNAQIYRYAYRDLPPGADMAGERASYLQLAARRQHARLADQLDELPLDRPWTARWARGQRPHSHYIAGRHDGKVTAVAAGVRQGRPVIVSGDENGTVRVWDLDTGELVLGPLAGRDDGTVTAVAVGVRQGRPVIVSGGGDSRAGTVQVWDLDTGEPVPGPLAGHASWVTAVAVGVRQGRPVIVSGGGDGGGGAVRVWDLDTGELVLGPLAGHAGGVTAVAVGVRQGRPVIVSGGWDVGGGTVRVSDLDTGELVLGPLAGDAGRPGPAGPVAIGVPGRPIIVSGQVTAVAVGERQGRAVIVSGGADETVRVWDLDSGELVLGPLAGHADRVTAVAVGVRQGRPVIVSGGDRTVRVWDLDTGEPALGPLTGHAGPVYTVAVGVRQGRPVIVSGSWDRTVRVWDLDTDEPVLGPLAGHAGGVTAVAVGVRQGRPAVVSGGADETVRVWDLDSGELVLGPLAGHAGGVTAVAVGVRQGRPVIVSGGTDGAVRVWDLDTGEPVLGPLAAHARGVTAVPVGVRQGRVVIVSGGADGAVRVWDLDTGELALGPLTVHPGGVYAVALGVRQGRAVIVSGGLQGGVRVWDLDSGEPVPGPLTGQAGWVTAVAVGVRQGRPVIVSGGIDGTVRVWDLDTGEPVLGPLTGLAGQAGRVNAVAVGVRQGRPVIVSGAADRTVRVWDLEAERHAILRIELGYAAMSVASAADRLVIGTMAELLQVDLL
jgi:WD40 repeat protein